MSFLEELCIFPVKILIALIKLLGPILLGLCAVVILITNPLPGGCFCIGVLIAPMIWKRLGVLDFGANDFLTVFSWQQQKLQEKKQDFQMMLSVTKEKFTKEEQKLQKKIQRLANDTEALEQRYQNILTRKPDKIVFYEHYEPEAPSLISWLKLRLTPRR